MVGFLEGPELLIVLVFLVVMVVGLVLPLWALIDAAGRPDWVWQQVGSSKATYIILIVVGWFILGIVGLVTSIVYLASTRPRLIAVMDAPPGRLPDGSGVRPQRSPWPQPSPSTAPPPGWYTDPHDPSSKRWWDGSNWTEHQQ